MFGKGRKNDSLNFKSQNYQMKDNYNIDNLVIANLEYISNEITSYGLMIKKTNQKYIFEILNENRYREIFTGFIATSERSHYFNLPYVVDIMALKEQVSSVTNSISKYGLLLVLDDINTKNNIKKLKNK